MYLYKCVIQYIHLSTSTMSPSAFDALQGCVPDSAHSTAPAVTKDDKAKHHRFPGPVINWLPVFPCRHHCGVASRIFLPWQSHHLRQSSSSSTGRSAVLRRTKASNHSCRSPEACMVSTCSKPRCTCIYSHWCPPLLC